MSLKSEILQVFLANQRPFPEVMILSNPKFYFEYLFERSRGQRDKSVAASPRWLQDSINPYLEARENVSRITAACEDVSDIPQNLKDRVCLK